MSRAAKAATVAAAVGAVGAIGYGVPAIASAASASASPAPHTSPAGPEWRQMTAEKELSGSAAASVKAAVLAKVPGATVERMSAEDAAEKSGVTYEAHVRKSDGTQAQVLLDKNFKVLASPVDSAAVTSAAASGVGPASRAGTAARRPS